VELNAILLIRLDRKDLKNPPIAVREIYNTLNGILCRKDLKNPPTAEAVKN
jgi:hypothetical protein